jgi:hypothetical protein
MLLCNRRRDISFDNFVLVFTTTENMCGLTQRSTGTYFGIHILLFIIYAVGIDAMVCASSDCPWGRFTCSCASDPIRHFRDNREKIKIIILDVLTHIVQVQMCAR